MASFLHHDFDKADIKDTSKDDGGGVPCAACGEENASKKCKKRHKGCAQMLWCNSACEKESHEKKQVKKIEDEEGENVGKAGPTIDDAAIKKMMRTELRKERKKWSRRGMMISGNRIAEKHVCVVTPKELN